MIRVAQIAPAWSLNTTRKSLPLEAANGFRRPGSELSKFAVANEPMYTPNGALYLVRSAALVTAQTLFPAGCRGIVMDGIASIDIDGPEDWALAEAVAAAGLTWRGATAPAR